jgi:hypothetical protein
VEVVGARRSRRFYSVRELLEGTFIFYDSFVSVRFDDSHLPTKTSTYFPP